jgi:hypothetical protein
MKEGSNWSRIEVEAAVAAYGEMLRLELLGTQFNKKQRNIALQGLIGRNAGSIEFKHQNISAILNNAGFPYIIGYKPRGNFQGLLEDVVTEQLLENPELNILAAAAVARQDFTSPGHADLLSIMVDPPNGQIGYAGAATRVADVRQLQTKRNYLEIEGRNAALGLAGEKLVMSYEHERLWRAGHRQLADRIEHVAVSKGDHLGYDVLSFEESGRERLIEVKTTQFGPMTPFFATRNEVNVSIELADHYQLYRVFSFEKNAKLFALEGAIGSRCELTPTIFSAVPR